MTEQTTGRTARRMTGRLSGRPTPRRATGALAAAFGAVVLLAGCGAGGTGGTDKGGSDAKAKPSASATSDVKAQQHAELATRKTSLGTVLTDGKGYTLYRFDKDSSSASKCSGKCASFWPPATGQPRPADGADLPGELGRIKRADGTVQATYDGHPVYRFAKDEKPGQTAGDGVKGVWHVVKAG